MWHGTSKCDVDSCVLVHDSYIIKSAAVPCATFALEINKQIVYAEIALLIFLEGAILAILWRVRYKQNPKCYDPDICGWEMEVSATVSQLRQLYSATYLFWKYDTTYNVWIVLSQCFEFILQLSHTAESGATMVWHTIQVSLFHQELTGPFLKVQLWMLTYSHPSA